MKNSNIVYLAPALFICSLSHAAVFQPSDDTIPREFRMASDMSFRLGDSTQVVNFNDVISGVSYNRGESVSLQNGTTDGFLGEEIIGGIDYFSDWNANVDPNDSSYDELKGLVHFNAYTGVAGNFTTGEPISISLQNAMETNGAGHIEQSLSRSFTIEPENGESIGDPVGIMVFGRVSSWEEPSTFLSSSSSGYNPIYDIPHTTSQFGTVTVGDDVFNIDELFSNQTQDSELIKHRTGSGVINARIGDRVDINFHDYIEIGSYDNLFESSTDPYAFLIGSEWVGDLQLVAAVPELDTWVMMLAGMGFMGWRFGKTKNV